ncbi:2OG-Fe(II) oxygenase family oxidoreductase [Penicillium cosmopolitanum]|uniref:2OG-Fe(II) oxygenase family oxidoreductase n=1 Tax=Penicillium cosmopolitanum TaxID=1131564 RepID=A0A9W9W4Z8_9EURO|nr:2OG-Fe(II) oxygenase family oxidoreductase [Penicillium cosmopolitanum]KAJ5403546.1 2OG-Fe(II) oxygenase family oxidoreductase [Penicillium cosmopolitanum]
MDFFYLDFRNASTLKTLEQVNELVSVGNSVFKLPIEEKEEYSTEKHLPSRLQGYKRAGCSVGPFAQKKDGYESFSIHNNGVFGQDTLQLPQAFQESLPLVTTFMSQVHGYTECILSILSKALGLPNDLKDCHRKDKPSSANIALLKYLPWNSDAERIGNMAHTDMGTLTVVFTQSEGLQALLPGPSGGDEWSYIPPRPGHAIVNVGDSLRFLSNGALASSLHRVIPPPPPHSPGQDKFSCIYFLRPEFDAKFTDNGGRQVTSVEWHNQKYSLFREASLDPVQHGAMLTGRKGFLGASGQTASV